MKTQQKAKSTNYVVAQSIRYRERESEVQDKLYRKSKQFIWRIRMKFK